jgi:hypothetical protein
MADSGRIVDLSGDDLIVNNLYTQASSQGQAGTVLQATAIEGVTAGTAAASKAVVLDSGLAVSGIKNVTLAAGTATVDPLTFTAGTNLTTAAAGAVEYDGNAFYATALASARQQVDAEQYILQGADSSAASNAGLDSATAAQVFVSPAGGQVTLTAGKTYCFEGMYLLTNTGTTSHTWATVLGGTATFSAGSGYFATGNSGTTASTPATGSLQGFISSTTLSTPVVVTAASTSATEQVSVLIKGTLVINAGGTLIPQMKASARPGGTGTPGVVVKAGSYFRIWQMGNATSVGNWS